MAGSYFQNHNFGLSAVDLSNVTTTEKYLGSANGIKTSKTDAGYIDFTEGRTYSLKQTLQMRKVVKLKGNREKVEVTYGGTVVAEAQTVTIDGISLSVTPSAATAAGLATAVSEAIAANADLSKKWTATTSSAKVIITSKKEDGGYTYSDAYYGASASAVTVTVAHTEWGANLVTIALYTTPKADDASPVKILEVTASVADLASNGQTEYEITIPSNMKRYGLLGIKKAASGDILGGTSIFPVLPIRV